MTNSEAVGAPGPFSMRIRQKKEGSAYAYEFRVIRTDGSRMNLIRTSRRRTPEKVKVEVLRSPAVASAELIRGIDEIEFLEIRSRTKRTRMPGCNRLVDGTLKAIAPAGHPVVPVVPLVAPSIHRPPEARPEVRREIFRLDEGEASIVIPGSLGGSSYQDLEDWLLLVLRKAWRSLDRGNPGEAMPPRPIGIEHEVEKA